jgi:XRE family transcriptional regulator, regulator of sulfur utilization
MITKRDLVVATLSAAAALGTAAFANSPPKVMSSTLVEWSSVEAKPTDVGSVRQFFRAPTATLDELELHVTTLNPGVASHAPHQHPNEELVIIREGTVEVLVNGKMLRAGPSCTRCATWARRRRRTTSSTGNRRRLRRSKQRCTEAS